MEHIRGIDPVRTARRCVALSLASAALCVAATPGIAHAQFLVDGFNSAMGASSSLPDAAHFQHAAPSSSNAVYVGFDGVSGVGYLDNTSVLESTGTGGGSFDTSGNWGIGVGIFPGGEGYLINTGAGVINSASEIRVGDGFDGAAYGELHHSSTGDITAAAYLTVGNYGGTGKFVHTGSGDVNVGFQLWIGVLQTGAAAPGVGEYTLNNADAQVNVARILNLGVSGGQGKFIQQAGAVTVGTPGEEENVFPELYVGQDGPTSQGQYDLNGGTLTVNGWTNIGRDGGQGTFNNSGTLRTTRELRVGAHYFVADGEAEFNNLDGGVVHAGTNDTIPAIAIGTGFAGNTTAVGRFNQHGAGSSVVADGWLVVGDSGSGFLDETNGTMTIRDNLIVGNAEGSSGEFTQSAGVNTVEGVYPTYTGNFVVGNAGTGVFTQSGGQNNLTASTATTVAASVSVQNQGDLSEAQDGNFVLGAAPTGVGTVNHSGGATTIAANLGVGLEGAGTYTLSGTGTVTVGQHTSGGDVLIAAAATSTGAFNLQGGTLDVTRGNGHIAAGLGAASFTFTGGTLRAKEFNSPMFGGNLGPLVQNGAGSLLDATNNSTTIHGAYNLMAGAAMVGAEHSLSASGGVMVGAGGTLGGNGQVISPTVTVASGGALAPGESIGSLEIDGDAALAGTLMIELNSDTMTIDLLDVSGELDITGAKLSLTNLGAAALAGPLVFAEYGALEGGAFAMVDGMPLGYSIDYAFNGGTQIALVAGGLTPMPDLNMDGKVDIFDVAIVSNNWASAGTPGTVTGDANKDGVVDIFDVALISNNWNPGGGASAVPEPGAAALALVAIGGACLAARRRRR